MSGFKQAHGGRPPSLRVLVFHDDQGSLDALMSHLPKEAFEVHAARSFVDAAPLLVGNHVDVLLIYLPPIEWVQRAVLHEIRRANGKLPIVAVAAAISSSLADLFRRLRVIRALPAPVDRPILAQALRDAAGVVPA